MPTLASFQDFMLITALGTARVGTAVAFLPFFAVRLLGGAAAKGAVIVALVMGLVPAITHDMALDKGYIVVVTQEILIGSVISIAFAAPFWAATAFGEMIDNQRGATISSTFNPAAGVETSPLSTLMLYYWSALFVLGGGLSSIVQVLHASYQAFPVGGAFVLSFDMLMRAVSLTSQAIAKALVLAAPAMVGMLLTELLLGLLSRLAPQLNAFAVAISVKSFVAFLILLPYLSVMVPPALRTLARQALGTNGLGG